MWQTMPERPLLGTEQVMNTPSGCPQTTTNRRVDAELEARVEAPTKFNNTPIYTKLHGYNSVIVITLIATVLIIITRYMFEK